MSERTDEELLRAFVDRGDQGAFRALVDRHIRAVHAAARRQIHDAHLAEDVAQATFVMLARKAGTIRDAAVLGGWLITTARLAAKSALRGEARRRRRETRAATMSLQNDHSGRSGDAADTAEREDAMQRIDAQLDEALARLKPADRTAVTLRYLESRPLREVAQIMGTSEPAASKRVARAVARLKKIFRRRGINLTPAALVGGLERAAQIEVPVGLADSAFATATGTGTTAAGSAAVAIALDAMARASLRAALLATTFVLLLIGATLTIGALAYRPATHTLVTLPPPPPSPVAASQPVLRVGVYISHDTAHHLTPGGKPRGWADQLRILDEIKPFPVLDVRPLIEPGTGEDPQQAQRLRQHFAGKGAINVTDADALRRELDVILVSAVCEPRTDALDAIEAAVRRGTGLVVRQCLGGHSTRLGANANPQLRLLRGIDECHPEMVTGRSGRVTAEVVASHPLLGSLSDRPGARVAMTIYGAYGTLAPNATGLLQVHNVDVLRHLVSRSNVEPRAGWSFFPLNVAQLDAGRIVSCSFGVNGLPHELDLATQGRFTLNALQWAAGRRID